ncbi:helix-turn-helix transcriptional regulator [Streptomyces sp. AV19]|uniref:helix-turn-helix domain-containing protein n=1 Tax=Streptomyces sp. AV19 TaxID=2793068 RepID=UPI0018FE197A|nr:helix-turn-helix transcriptional regulator [Streptomyces sp. AV19]MBH1936598.1 helix-turn-helix transcriptional regulator [Streptomyces sp. AV19]MDG4532658.1 helix-turn-helix domain-containing protein [Streptomyces sp. AV19]
MAAETSEVRWNVKKYRRAMGMSQEALADASGLSVKTVQKVEQGGHVLTETPHAVARGLGVPTSELFAAGVPAPVIGDEETRQSLVPLRMALMPPLGLDGVVGQGHASPDRLADLWREIMDAHALYRADEFDSVARRLPALLTRADAAVNTSEGDERQHAVVTHSLALLVAGKYLTQVRQYDMAYHALAEGIRLAREAGERRIAATGVVGMCWLLLRQDRFAECSHLAVTTAELMEPRMTEADGSRVGLWGELWMRAAAAAIRDNRPDDAKAARRMVARAAAGMEREDRTFPATWGGFGPVTAAIKSIEDCLVIGNSVGDARAVLARAEEDVLSSKSLKRVGKPQGANWARHRLDVARAHTILGAHQDATDELLAIRSERGAWIKHQPMARRVMADVLKSRKRTLTQDMREMAGYLAVVE